MRFEDTPNVWARKEGYAFNSLYEIHELIGVKIVEIANFQFSL